MLKKGSHFMQGWSLYRLPTMVCSCTDTDARSALLASLRIIFKRSAYQSDCRLI